MYGAGLTFSMLLKQDKLLLYSYNQAWVCNLLLPLKSHLYAKIPEDIVKFDCVHDIFLNSFVCRMYAKITILTNFKHQNTLKSVRHSFSDLLIHRGMKSKV